MGYLRHEAIVVSGWDADRVLKAHSAAGAIFDRHGMGRLVSGLVQHVTNGGAAFFVSPDGSKEGWEDSRKGDAARAELVEFLTSKDAEGLWLDWCHLLLGGDDGEYRVINSPETVDRKHEDDVGLYVGDPQNPPDVR